jgi:fructosamine-3-kinase
VKPALMHGNLWYDNKMRSFIQRPVSLTDTAIQEDVLFDDSSAWCQNEFEMGILVLFGGFSAGFFQASRFVLSFSSQFVCGREAYGIHAKGLGDGLRIVMLRCY